MKFKKLLSIIMVAAISLTALCYPLLISAKADYSYKIDPALAKKLDKMSDDDTVDVSIWLNDVDEETKNKAIEKKLKEKYEKGDISGDLYSNSSLLKNESVSESAKLSVKDTQTLLSIKHSSYKEIHSKRNAQWQNSISNKLNTFRLVYSSCYAPVVVIEIAKTELEIIVSSNEVEYLFYYDNTMVSHDDKYKMNQNTNPSKSYDYGLWSNITGIDSMRYVFGYAGNGIKIGLLDNGVPDINHSSGVFNNRDITLVNNTPIDDHATYMASILVGKTGYYNGVVPRAELYCAGFKNGYIGPIETLIDNDINILSISLGLGGNSGVYNTYGNYSKYLDYIVYNYDTTVCICSGNNSDNPGVSEGCMGYNSITVGNLDDNNTVSHDDDVINSLSSYVTSDTEAYKPDLCAPGARVGTPVAQNIVCYGNGGTSAATPVIAGICALLMQSNATLMAKPMLLKSALMSSARRVPNMDSVTSTSTTTAPALSRRYGAGLVYVMNAYTILDSGKYKYISLDYQEQNQNPYTLNVPVTQTDVNASKKLAVCLTWTQKVVSDSSNPSINPLGPSFSNDYYIINTVYSLYHHDLGVYDSNNNLVAYSDYQYDRKQFIYFKPTVAGTYKIKVYKTGTSQADALTAIAYHLNLN